MSGPKDTESQAAFHGAQELNFPLLSDPDGSVAAKFKDCGIHVLDAPTELVPAALNHLGLEPNSHDVGDIKRAAELLQTLRGAALGA